MVKSSKRDAKVHYCLVDRNCRSDFLNETPYCTAHQTWRHNCRKQAPFLIKDGCSIFNCLDRTVTGQIKKDNNKKENREDQKIGGRTQEESQEMRASASTSSSGGSSKAGDSSADDNNSRDSSSAANYDQNVGKCEPKVYRLCHQVSVQNLQGERMKSGSFNRVVAIQCNRKNLPQFLSSHNVLRVPRDSQARTENSLSLESSELRDQNTVLQYVSSQMPSITATIAAFDLSANNPLNSEYSLQSRLIDATLEAHYSGMSLPQKIDQVPTIGLLVATDHLLMPSNTATHNAQDYT